MLIQRCVCSVSVGRAAFEYDSRNCVVVAKTGDNYSDAIELADGKMMIWQAVGRKKLETAKIMSRTT